jgi:hypothetical protein
MGILESFVMRGIRKIDGLSRRDLFRSSGTLGALLAGTGITASRASAGPLTIGPDIYQSIGVRPIINCKGTFTIISGSLSLPEVKRAMEEAGRHYVHMDDLMDGVGRRLAEITGAPWGIVTAGCAAAMTHVTTACLVGTDPEPARHQERSCNSQLFAQRLRSRNSDARSKDYRGLGLRQTRSRV